MTTNETTERAAHCLFCGEHPGRLDPGALQFAVESGAKQYWLTCACGAMGPGGKTQDEAIAAWNRRAALPPPVAEPVHCIICDMDISGSPAAALDCHHPASPAPSSAEDARYNELIFAVGRKHAGETRHDTALRYIRQAEQMSDGPVMQTTTGSGE